MQTESTIRAYQGILRKWVFPKPTSFSEKFAYARFSKKFEEPVVGRDSDLADKAWEEYESFDNTLPKTVHLPSGEWYKARHIIHDACRDFRLRSQVDFPKGSSLVPTRGFNSIESRLASGHWTCTPENFAKFSRLVYTHKALKRAFRKRYTRWFLKSSFRETFKEADHLLWAKFSREKNPGLKIFEWKLERVVKFVRGSRFSTVPKNNTSRRPINVEPLGNILVQRQHGLWFREVVESKFGHDLLTLQDTHRERISNPMNATIDLKNASDAVSIALVEFLFPKNVCESLHNCRSGLLYGHDGNYHSLRKISSMGNGFTFELMTLILTSICKVLDPDSSVFGDDIIIDRTKAHRLISLLEEVGFKVNTEKSFIEGPFRESCGGNHHIEEGYIKSYDFNWPTTIGDCALILSKCSALRMYPGFSAMYDQLLRWTPSALRGGPSLEGLDQRSWDSEAVPSRFVTDISMLPTPNAKLLRFLKKTYCVTDVRVAVEFVWVPSLRTPTVRKLRPQRHWAKYEMYLASNQCVADVVTNEGTWATRKIYYLDGCLSRLTRKELSSL